ncbi:phage tail protein [Carnobacteriaceae bacterium zg-ZUI78]|nr:phage tail protein [Carnobacteriaceae bacterium zg-ZUI78]
MGKETSGLQTQETNKVTYGLENVHFSVITERPDGTHEYGTPIPIRGAVELGLEPQGEAIKLKADNIIYFADESNEGYTGTLKVFLLPEEFMQQVLGETIEGGLVTEKAGIPKKSFALMFQFEGDKNAVRHVLYNCNAKRPKVSSATKDGANYNNDELSFEASPRPKDKVIKRKTNKNTAKDIYDNWFKAVPDVTSVGG